MEEMGARWLVLLAAAACSSARGADLEIAVPVQADEVDVFVAPYQCSDCDSAVGWDNSNGKRGADGVFKLDVDQVTVAQPLGNGHYRVVLVGKDSNPVARIVIVAFQAGTVKAAAVLQDVVLPVHRAETWDVPLDASVVDVPPGDPRPTSDGWRLRAWPPMQQTTSRCVVSEVFSNGMMQREFYLRPGDTDCDGVSPDKECDPFYYLDPGSATIDTVSCIQTFPWPTMNNSTCMLGGMGCSEISTNPTGCVRVQPEYCAAQSLCDTTCTAALETCVHDGQISAIHCTAITPGLDVACANGYAATFTMAPLVGASMQTCDEMRFDNAQPPMLSFDTQWQPGGGANGQPTFTAQPSSNGAPCDFDLQMTPGSPVSFQDSYVTLADVKLSNGRHDVIPIQVQVQVGTVCPAMGSALTCNYVEATTADSIRACATVP